MSEKFSAAVPQTVAVDARCCQIVSMQLTLATEPGNSTWQLNLNPRMMDDNSGKQMSTLLVKNTGRLEYLAAIQLQERLVSFKQQASLTDILLLVEHPHVYTLGRGGNAANLLAPR
ncbi:MAG: hypothetical protein ACXWXT_08110, partial [Candidatus Binatia bacterium]